MATSYDDAVAALFQAPHDAFVEERKRLATELKTAGDKTAAARLSKLARPPISAWVVNQLWWRARDAFDELLGAAERVRAGDLGALSAHRDAIAKLRTRAAEILTDAGHATTEATLRRATATLSALAAAGGFDPELPGSLSADRDPPGFEAAAIAGGSRKADEKVQAEPEPEQERAVALAEQRRIEQERAEKKAERERLEVAVHGAKRALEALEREVERVRNQFTLAEDAAEQARAARRDLEARLAEHEPDEPDDSAD